MSDDSFDFSDVSRGGPAFSDRFHPIVVRQMRRLTRSLTFKAWIVFSLLLSCVGIVFALVFIGSHPSPESTAIWANVGLLAFSMIVPFAAVSPAVMCTSARQSDDSLDRIFPTASLLRGYVYLGLTITLFFTTLSLPFLALAVVYGASPTVFLWSITFTLVYGIASNLFCISFSAKARSGFGAISSVVASLILFNLCFSCVLWLEMFLSFLLFRAGGVGPWTPGTVNDVAFHLFSIFQCLSFGILAYGLSYWHLSNPQRSPWLDQLLNIVIYFLAISILCGLWYGLRILIS